MPLTVEDGTGLSDAQCYVSVAEVKTYAAARGKVLPTPDSKIEELIVQATDYLENQEYLGTKITRAQALQWPRTGVADPDFKEEDIPDDEVPRRIKNAQCQLVIEGLTRSLLPSSDGRQVIKEKVDVLEVAYAAGKDLPQPVFPLVNMLIDPLLSSSGSGYGPLSTLRV